jgi:hypothetical protein
MNIPLHRWLNFAIAVCLAPRPAVSGQAHYLPAYFEHIPTKSPRLLVFPAVGEAMEVPLPANLPQGFRLIEFSPDGRVAYGQKLFAWDGITKIQFNPPRQELIRGSEGFGTVSSIVPLGLSGKMLLSGVFKSERGADCGIFELNPGAPRVHRLFEGKFPNCGGAISPDGKHSVQFPGNRLSIIDLDTGMIHEVAEGLSGATWSPDGRWIAAIADRADATTIILVNANDPTQRRKLGPSKDSQAQWSPDSRSLLIAKPNPSQCGPDLWGLEIIDIQTGTRRAVASARCKIFQNSTGWLYSGVLR